MLFLAFLVAISFIPLLNATGWQAYPPAGSFAYESPSYYLRYNDPSFGNDKPIVFVKDQGRDISLIEVSDQESILGDRFIFGNFDTKTTLVDGILNIHYDSENLSFVKRIVPASDGVLIAYIFDENVELELTLWRWYFQSIESFDRPITRNLEPQNVTHFTIFDKGLLYEGELSFTPIPRNITISGEERLNKITLSMEGQEITVKVKLNSVTSLNEVGRLDLSGSRILYPIIGVGLSIIYIAMKKASERSKPEELNE